MTETPKIAKHTPGPWNGLKGHLSDNVRGIYDLRGRPIVVFNGIARPTSDEGAANARLIAAAPDMLEALMPIMSMEMWTESAKDDEIAILAIGTIRKMRAAVARATSSEPSA